MSGQAISFCRSCSNMLVPRESKADKKLLLACRGCGLSQECASAVVFKHELVKSAANELEQIPDDIITDPTLQREQGDQLEISLPSLATILVAPAPSRLPFCRRAPFRSAA